MRALTTRRKPITPISQCAIPSPQLRHLTREAARLPFVYGAAPDNWSIRTQSVFHDRFIARGAHGALPHHPLRAPRSAKSAGGSSGLHALPLARAAGGAKRSPYAILPAELALDYVPRCIGV